MAHGLMEEWKEQASPSDKKCGAEGRVMGSRRIFAPQFKLQVLDSYRQDADCKGNQRATARKYGIHRRQIQKWLQMENHLRSITSGAVAGAVAGAAAGAVAQPLAPADLGDSEASERELAAAEPAALNLSCESARLLGGVGRVEPPTSVHGPASSPASSPTGLAPTACPATYVLRPSVSPTLPDRELPIKKRYFEGLIPDVPSHPGSPRSDEDLEDDDDEDIDVDVDGTESETSSQAALDYTSATLSKRRSFSLQFKLEVLDAFHNDPLCQGNQRATARAFGINRRQVQKWLGQEPELRDEAVSRGGLNRQRLGRWLDQDQLYVESGGFCLDLSRKRKGDCLDKRDVEEFEVEPKKARSVEPVSSSNRKIKLEELPKEEIRSPRSDTSEVSSSAEDWFRQHPHLPPHTLLFRPQPLPFMPLPGADSLYPLPLHFSMCEKRYSLDLKLGPLDLYSAHQQNLQKWLKQEDFLKHGRHAVCLQLLMLRSKVCPAEHWYDIHLRYQDTALVVFKEQSAHNPTNYLTFGINRKSDIIHNYGNPPLILHRREKNSIRYEQTLRSSVQEPSKSQDMQEEQVLNGARGAETTRPGQWYNLAITGGTPEPRVGHTASYLPLKKKVVLIGGASPCALYSEVWQIDLQALTSSLLTLQGDNMESRYEHCAYIPPSQDAQEGQEKIWVFAGANMEGNLNDLWELDVSAKEWHKLDCTGDVPSSRTMHTTTAAVDGNLQLVGGGCQAASPVVDRSVYQLDHATLTWRTLVTQGTPPISRQGHILVGCNGKLFCHGGMAGNKFFSDLHVLENGEWHAVADTEQQPSARAGHGAVCLDQYIYIFGGLGADGSLNDLWKLNTETLLWEEIRFESDSPRPKPRLDFAMSLVWLPPRFMPSYANGEAITQNGAQSDDSNSPDSEQDLPFIFLHGGMDDLGTIFNDFHVFRLDGPAN